MTDQPADRVITDLHGRWLIPPAEVEVDQGLLPTPLVLLHGFTGDTTTWERLAAELPRDRGVWAVDLVGHGQSPAPDDPRAYRMASVLESLRLHLERNAIRQPHAVGYSMGGRIALSLALAYPGEVASLVLIGASPGFGSAEEARERRRQDHGLARSLVDGLESFVDRWMANPLFTTQARLGEAYLAEARAQRLRSDPNGLALTLRELGTGAMPSLVGRLNQVRQPVLLVAGALDAKFSALAEAMASDLPQPRVEIVPDSGHAVQVEAPRQMAELITGFVAEVERRRPPG